MTQPKFKGKYRTKSSRLANRNYAANSWYFVTVCTGDRNPFFGNVNSSQIQLSAIGKIAQKFWAILPIISITHPFIPTSSCLITYTASLLLTDLKIPHQ
jgi:hypothetical protein